MTSERPAVVLVEFRDAFLASSGWTEREESIESSREMIADPLSAAGFLLDDTPVGIVVAVAFNQHADEVVGAIAIPREAVVKITQLRPARGRFVAGERS